jgi:hypothetical protein
MNAIRYRHRITDKSKREILFEQACVAVVGAVGWKHAKLVVIDFPVRVIKVPVEDVEKYGEELKDYTALRAARAMLDAGTRMGIRKAAKKLLNGVIQNATRPTKEAHGHARRVWGKRR